MTDNKELKRILDSVDDMTTEELCGQVLCLDLSEKDDSAEVERLIEKMKPGGIFIDNISKQKSDLFLSIANKYSVTPVIVAADIENGPDQFIGYKTCLPHSMAWGACNNPALIEEAGELSAKICRARGIHWTFAPVVDINMNFNNPVTNIRAVSAAAEPVIKIAGAYARGMRKNNLMAVCPKHFPGDGVDDRNQHFCTSVNSLSKEEWDATYGKVYSEMIKEGVESIMVAHIALPCYDDDYDPVYGYKPGVLSEKIITGLLREKLGFNGCIVSDAMSMLGSVTRVNPEKLASTFIAAGGDMVLFPDDTDSQNLQNAVNNGELSLERLKDAVRHVLTMKYNLGLFNEQKYPLPEGTVERFKTVSRLIAEGSIKIVRNEDGVLPLKLPEKGKVLIINMMRPFSGNAEDDRSLDIVNEELIKRGYETRVIVNPKHYLVKKIMNDYDCVLINCKMSSRDYHGGSLRIGWDTIMTFWRGYVLNHKQVVFTSFGDPYKLYELPFLRTYINTFSGSESSQRAAVKVILGEIESTAKNPVSLKGFFEREI